MLNSLINNKKTVLFSTCSIILYVFFAYQFERVDFYILLTLFSFLFLFAFKIIQFEKENFYFLIGISIVFRLLFIVSLPNLSQDYFRFIWDGRILLEGINPYIHVPNDLIQNTSFNISQAKELHQGMGELSASHFSNYPPFNQLLFAVAAFFGNESILGTTIVLRLTILMADIGILHFGTKLLTNLGIEKSRIFWYVLNPLVIIELTGNLHFEGVMLFFFVWSMYKLQQNKWLTAAVLLALAISIKLLPLLLLPLFFQRLGIKKSIAFYSIIIGINILLFLPFLSADLIENYTATIGLWFTNFEFNASFYYLIREVGFWIAGHNIIYITGKIIPVLMIVFIIYQAFYANNKSSNNLLSSSLLVLTIYFFASTTVHPWYIINLVVLAVFSNFKYPIVWSFSVFLSYSAYQNSTFKENFWLIGLEYILVLLFFLYELNTFSTINKNKYI